MRVARGHVETVLLLRLVRQPWWIPTSIPQNTPIYVFIYFLL